MLYFLKLGGSLITVKGAAQTARPEALARLAGEIAEALAARPDLRLVLGHGSGSFGHSEATKYGTREGVRTPDEWRGFAQVSAAAARLNRLVTDALLAAEVPVVTLQPSASAASRDGVIESLAVAPILAALEHGLIPLINGDVAFDAVRGGTILSTEDLFRWLAPRLRPARILLAGAEAGVYSDWPNGRTVAPRLTASEATHHAAALRGAETPDVTGGMASKVAEMLALAHEVPGLETLIFSGEAAGNVFRALTGEADFGTRIST
jgi:isopentenyl phosphate kinase